MLIDNCIIIISQLIFNRIFDHYPKGRSPVACPQPPTAPMSVTLCALVQLLLQHFQPDFVVVINANGSQPPSQTSRTMADVQLAVARSADQTQSPPFALILLDDRGLEMPTTGDRPWYRVGADDIAGRRRLLCLHVIGANVTSTLKSNLKGKLKCLNCNL